MVHKDKLIWVPAGGSNDVFIVDVALYTSELEAKEAAKYVGLGIEPPADIMIDGEFVGDQFGKTRPKDDLTIIRGPNETTEDDGLEYIRAGASELGSGSDHSGGSKGLKTTEERVGAIVILVLLLLMLGCLIWGCMKKGTKWFKPKAGLLREL